MVNVVVWIMNPDNQQNDHRMGGASGPYPFVAQYLLPVFSEDWVDILKGLIDLTPLLCPCEHNLP